MQQLVEFGSPHARFLWPLSMARVAGRAGLRLRHAAARPAVPRAQLPAVQLRPRRQPARRLLRLDDRAVPPAELQLPAAARPRALLPRHLLRQRVLRPDHRRRADLRQRQRRRRQRPRPGARHAVLHGAGGGEGHHVPHHAQHRHRPALAGGAAVLLALPRPPARGRGAPTPDCATPSGCSPTSAPTRCSACTPTTTSNRPGDIVQQYWDIYPRFLRDLFVQAFVTGHRHRRPPGSPRASGSRRWTGSATAWSRAAPAAPPTSGTPPTPTAPAGPATPRSRRRSCSRSAGATSRSARWPRCAPTTSPPGSTSRRTLGRTRQHPQAPERWGLHNTSEFAWQVAYPGGHHHVLEPNQTIEMVDGARIQIRVGDRRRTPPLTSGEPGIRAAPAG